MGTDRDSMADGDSMTDRDGGRKERRKGRNREREEERGRKRDCMQFCNTPNIMFHKLK